MFICKQCGYETTTNRGLVSHISCVHKMKIQDYYIKYISSIIPKCYCGNDLPFDTLQTGYKKFCCQKCANSYTTTKRWEINSKSFNVEQRIETTRKLHGGCRICFK